MIATVPPKRETMNEVEYRVRREVEVSILAAYPTVQRPKVRYRVSGRRIVTTISTGESRPVVLEVIGDLMFEHLIALEFENCTADFKLFSSDAAIILLVEVFNCGRQEHLREHFSELPTSSV